MAEGLDTLANALSTNGFKVQRDVDVAAESALIGHRSDFRWHWLGTRLHSFVIAYSLPSLTRDRAEDLTAAAQSFAIKHKPGLPRGLQTGTATFATFVCDAPGDGVRSWFAEKPRHRFGAGRFPVLADPSAGELMWFSGRMVRGSIYRQHVHWVVKDVIAPGLQLSA